ncbi:aldehyde dehydrogenase family protein [Aquitalea sp. LB_tupeE]|uniref:aldehyde dehydrogenase family protein n=1 Tax=Aquitalea sp. LB_tupeE TaxID=2748078 RepID=UPI0015B89350|nr:aldehyde dehydrogenase family protein [Aquitalea sp. LB_tupeE]NWK78792.1 aldehyde dehydrogenase family protein [Aquitalea sp. LB_tupeE]
MNHNSIFNVQKPTICSVNSPYDNSHIGSVVITEKDDVDTVIKNATYGSSISAMLTRAERSDILLRVADKIKNQAEKFAITISREAGKTLTQARKEVARCVNTLRLSAEEAKRLTGEIIPFDSYVGSENRFGYFTYEPLGIILAITPFNDPLNLVAHKIGPAIAAGNSLILKPSLLAPLSSQGLVEAFWDAGLPRDILQIAHGDADLASELVARKEIRMITFTGGAKTGETITRTAGLKKIAMDLGGNAPVIVMPDCDLLDAAESCVSGAFWAAGQNCIGTQRIFVAKAIFEQFSKCMVEITERMVIGNPMLDTTDMGPMITEDQAIRVKCWVDSAVQEGAIVLTGNVREGAVYHPTILTNVPCNSLVWKEEIFAPVVSLVPFENIEEAIAEANNVESSLHAAIFTNNLEIAMMVSEKLEAGGVMINDSSDYRFDGMPFGGFKYGSLGREGVKFSVHEMSQPKVVCFRRPV